MVCDTPESESGTLDSCGAAIAPHHSLASLGERSQTPFACMVSVAGEKTLLVKIGTMAIIGVDADQLSTKYKTSQFVISRMAASCCCPGCMPQVSEEQLAHDQAAGHGDRISLLSQLVKVIAGTVRVSNQFQLRPTRTLQAVPHMFSALHCMY
jgi:hypothetical protein